MCIRDSNNIDIAAANLLFQPQRAEKFQLGPSYTSASWQLVYKKGENRPKDLAQVQQEIIIPSRLPLGTISFTFSKDRKSTIQTVSAAGYKNKL